MDYWQDFEVDEYYHIYNRSGSGINLFRDPDDFHGFLIKFDHYLGGCFYVYAYCLMPNHFHLLIKVRSLENITEFAKLQNTNKGQSFVTNQTKVNEFIVDQFRRFFSSYAITYKNKYNHIGSVFMKKFKRIQSNSIEKNMYWLAYIHHNPIHHKYNNEYGMWKYNSYNAYFSIVKTRIKKEEVIYEWFNNMDDFLKYHQNFKLDFKKDIETE